MLGSPTVTATRRLTGEDCPDVAPVVHMEHCQPCPYFRGASSITGRPGWLILCNWPRNGSEIATPERLPERPTVPAVFYEEKP
jgi:hypothetical protein